MNESRNHLMRDLQGVRYLEALEAGDLEAVAALWEEASADAELERTLSEIDGALFREEARGHRRGRSKRRWVCVGAAGTLAAACLLATLLLRERGGKESPPRPGIGPAIPEVVHRASDQPDPVAATRLARRELDETKLPSFPWPLAQISPTTPTSMPADLVE
jgi:hypothetical protein